MLIYYYSMCRQSLWNLKQIIIFKELVSDLNSLLYHRRRLAVTKTLGKTTIYYVRNEISPNPGWKTKPSVNHIYQPLHSGRIWHKVIFKRSLTGLNSEFSFFLTSCITKTEETSLPYYLPIAGGWIIGFIPFPRVLVLSEMQSASSRIRTRVAVSISYDTHYTTGTSKTYC